jgi:hypothetical protein
VSPVDDEVKLTGLIAEFYEKTLTIDPLMLEKFSLHNCVLKYERVLLGNNERK